MSPGDPPPPSGGPAQGFPRSFGTKYQLLKHIATGGMADVFLARQLGGAGFVKECVIKRILPHLVRDQQFVTMFLDEARVTARLNHPNIAQVYDHGRIGEDYFMAMEYVDGVDLEQVLDTADHLGEKRLPYPIAARIVAGVAEGLAHAHAALDPNGDPLALVHRDVTPSNIVISFEGVPKLLDFGVAKAASKLNKTDVGIIKGKVPYMSPEQVQGEALDARSDLFALGAILYQLTTGHKPFTGDNPAGVALKLLHHDPTPPTLLIADYPEELEAIVMAALAKKTAERTPSARAMQVQLEHYLMHARTPTTSYDVAHYLMARFPRKQIGSSSAALAKEALEKTDAIGGESGPMSSDQPQRKEPSGMPPVSIGDPALLGELGTPGGRDHRRSMGGSGSWMAGAIFTLVVLVGVGFYFLRAQEQRKEAAQAASEAAASTTAPPGGEARSATPSAQPAGAPAMAPSSPVAAVPPRPASPPAPAAAPAKPVAPAIAPAPPAAVTAISPSPPTPRPAPLLPPAPAPAPATPAVAAASHAAATPTASAPKTTRLASARAEVKKPAPHKPPRTVHRDPESAHELPRLPTLPPSVE